MLNCRNVNRAACLLLLLALTSSPLSAQEEKEAVPQEQIAELVEQLNADEAADREAAQKELIELGLKGDAEAGDAFLNALPKPNDNMPQEVQARLGRISSEIKSRLAKQAIEATRVTLDVTDAPLADVLKDIEKQTGNRVIDHREQFGQEATEKKITLKVENEPYWSAFDKLLDAAQMQPYAFSGEDTLAIVDREQGMLRRAGRGAVYSGPFRIESTGIVAERGLRSPDQSTLRVDLEIGWEPRLKPIALTQAAGDTKAVADDGRDVAAATQDAAFDVEIEAGTHAAEVNIPLQLPAREAKKLNSLTGKFTALVPGRIVELKFEKLAGAKEITQQTGGVTVTLDRVVRNQSLWELHMKVRLDSLEGGLESHRSWVFQNISFLQDKSGEHLDNAGFETTSQTESEAGFLYLFELPEGRELSDYVWIYRTPASIVSMPVEFELKDVELP